MATNPRRTFPLSPSLVLGIGLGGFVDGILLAALLVVTGLALTRRTARAGVAGRDMRRVA